MQFIRHLYKFNSSILAVLTALSAIPVLANTPKIAANFGSLTLSPGFKPAAGKVTGYTGGSYSLSTIANRDRQNNTCIGFGDSTPDHIIVLKQDFTRLKLQVNSRGYDTTLLVQGPRNKILCGDDTGNTKDASVEGAWTSGTYRVWVGGLNAGVKRRYTLSVVE